MKKKLVTLIAAMGVVMCAFATDMAFVKELVAIPSASADIPQVNRAMRTMKDCEAEVVRYSPPVNSDPNHPLVHGALKAMQEVCGKGELDRMAGATDARCFVNCNVPIAIAGTLGGNAHGDDEWADPKTFDLFGEWLSRFLSDPDKYASAP